MKKVIIIAAFSLVTLACGKIQNQSALKGEGTNVLTYTATGTEDFATGLIQTSSPAEKGATLDWMFYGTKTDCVVTRQGEGAPLTFGFGEGQSQAHVTALITMSVWDEAQGYIDEYYEPKVSLNFYVGDVLIKNLVLGLSGMTEFNLGTHYYSNSPAHNVRVEVCSLQGSRGITRFDENGNLNPYPEQLFDSHVSIQKIQFLNN